MPRSTNLPSEKIIGFLLITALSACTGSEWCTTESGLHYRILKNGNGESFINGHYLYLGLAMYDQQDSLLFSTRNSGTPGTVQILDAIRGRRGRFFEGLEKLKVGDSAVFKVNCEDLYLVSLEDPIPEGVDAQSLIIFNVGVRHMSTPEEFRIWQKNIFAEKRHEMIGLRERQRLADMAEIDEYIELYGLEPLEHDSGIRYIINREGHGLPPENGDRVKIHYTGKLPDGTRVDNSYDRLGPVEFVPGSNWAFTG